MTPERLISELLERGVQLWTEGGELRFRAPPGALTPELRAAVAQRRPEVIAQVGRERRLAPASFAQRRLWLLERLQPGTRAYALPLPLRIRGALNVAALRAALAELVHRHETLRTTFAALAGQPVQVINAEGGLTLPLEELEGPGGEAREQAILQVVAEEAQRGFDLERGPLLRARLLRAAADDHVLLLALHHIITDGWSLGILTRELALLYQGFSEGPAASLPPLPLQYADFAAWQRDPLAGPRIDGQLDFWKRTLRDAPTVLELPADKPRPPVQRFEGAQCSRVLSPQLTEALRALGRASGASLFMTLLAVFQVLLRRSGAGEDFCLGTPVANRTQRDLEPLIGFFINTLVLRCDVTGNPRFRELLERTRQTALDAFAHQDTPFETLVEVLNVPRDLSRPPLAQVLFVLQNAPGGAFELPGLRLEPVELPYTTSRYDLTCTAVESREGLWLLLEYSTALFTAGSADALLDRFERLLRQVAAEPEQRILDLPLLTDEERRRLFGWSCGAAALPVPAACVHALFAEQAARTPDAIALESSDDRRMTYAELDRRSNQLAWRLFSAAPDQPIAVMLERSLELVVALLAILKVGGAYLPVDRAYAQPRQRFMLEDARAATVITEELFRELDRERVDPPPDRAHPDSLAYVVYTSGSTGQPKGVAVPHRAVARLVKGNGSLRFGPGDVFLQLAPVAFDASTLELWGPLLNGGRLVLAPPGPVSTKALAELLPRHGITTLWLSAALFHEMVRSHRQALAGVRTLLAGGDVLSPDCVREVLEELPGTHLINGYGPTENTTFTTCHPLDAGQTPSRASIPIGRPITHTTAFILDERLQPVPVGIPGELYAGGEGLARGYLNRPEATAARFIPHPFANRPGERLYATGDLARFLPDGTIEFLGRRDEQLKIRGFRVEAGEVEHVLRGHPRVREVAAVAHRDAAGDRALVAYVVAETPPPSTSELRSFMSEHVPDYLIPSHFLFLAALPVTAHGKLDRRALPAPGSTRPSSGGAPTPPRGELETHIAGVWKELLGLDQVGVEDNFFDLGGHSLAAARVHARLTGELEAAQELQLIDLFRHPTVRALARHLEGEAGAAAVTAGADRAANRRQQDEALEQRRAARQSHRSSRNSS